MSISEKEYVSVPNSGTGTKFCLIFSIPSKTPVSDSEEFSFHDTVGPSGQKANVVR
jgi:hypothetical protein